MANTVKIVECPRDAWQGLPGHIPASQKAGYLRALIAAGFQHIDAASFVSPAAVPQMSDSEECLKLLGDVPGGELIGIVVNARGAARAIATHSIHTLGFPYSISVEFLRRNQNQSPQESLRTLEAIAAMAQAQRLSVVAYISMAFGNPYSELWSARDVVHACRQLIDAGIAQISLSDTVGLASAAQITETVAHVIDACASTEIGVHLHARPQDAAEKIRAAYQAACRRFDSALGGLGGCPFAQDDLVGNIPTEILIAELHELGAELPALQPLDDLLRLNAEMTANFTHE
jgi:hydroxymethylglutaryl-CoA lyase